MRATCLQHVPFEGPGALARSFADRGVDLDCILVPKHGLPRDRGDMLVIMGGPMSVNDPDPWLKEETDFIGAAIRTGIPVLGVCLGSQFMAKALGATVRPGMALEIGITTIRLTEEARQDPVFGRVPEVAEVFEWHGEVFDLPPGSVSLAASDLCAHQAFRFGSHAYGLLFHLEMDRSGIEALCRECPEDLRKVGQTPSELLQRTEHHLPSLHEWADRLIGHLVHAAR